MDPIDRQQAIDAIMGEYPDAHYPDWYASKIKALPSAQQDLTYCKVIHCKECRYFGDLCPWSADQNGFCHKAYKKEELFI